MRAHKVPNLNFFSQFKHFFPLFSRSFFILRYSIFIDMSDDEVDEGLLALLRKSLGLDGAHNSGPAETKVLEHAEYIYNNSIDVALDSQGTKAAAAVIWASMQEKSYTFKTWSEHELHPKAKDESTVDFIFIMDLLNFSFWSDNPKPEHRFAVEYRGQIWTGYWSLVAALQRALEEGTYVGIQL